MFRYKAAFLAGKFDPIHITDVSRWALSLKRHAQQTSYLEFVKMLPVVVAPLKDRKSHSAPAPRRGNMGETSKSKLCNIAKAILLHGDCGLPTQTIPGVSGGISHGCGPNGVELVLSVSMLGSRRYAHHRRPAAAERFVQADQIGADLSFALRHLILSR
jgi:hypothetical protein